MLPSWQTAVVEKVLDASPNTRRYFLRLSQPFDFLAGQFITVDLPIHEKKQKRWRSYSIASAPDESDQIELLIVKAEPGTGGSEYIWNHWQVGSEAILRGPQGVFTAPVPAPEETLFLICTGTGIAPFRSMLLHWQRTATFPQQPVKMIFGCRTQSDLLYFDEMRQLAADFSQFEYIPVLSRESWPGKTGYVHAVYEALCAEKPKALFMLCGWRNIVDEARDRIQQMGYEKQHIILELYG